MDDFDIVRYVGDALASCCSTVKHIKTDTEIYPAITYFVYDYGIDAGADNRPVEVGYYIQVDIWSKTEADGKRLIPLILSAMDTAGFDDPHFQELYESDTKIYHIPCRFYYARNTEP